MNYHRHIRRTPMELLAGRLMRAPDHDNNAGGTGTADSPPPENNTGGNSGDSTTNGSGDQNNAGQTDTLSTFWNDPAAETPPANDSATDEKEEGATLGQTLLATIDAFEVPAAFTDDIVKEMGEGNFEGINKAVQDRIRAGLRQGLNLQTQMLQPIVATLLQRMQTMIDQRLGSRDNTETLLEAFPSAADPKVRPLIERTFQQALLHSKGDRKAAVDLTRNMLKAFGQSASADLGLEIPPSDPQGDGSGPLSSSEKSLVDELLGR